MTRTINGNIHQKLFTAVVSIFMILAGAAQAEVIFYQGFDYGTTGGNLSTIASNDWSKSSSGDALYKTTSLKQGDSPQTGGSVKTQSGWSSPRLITQTLDISLAGKNEFWVSCLISIDSASPAVECNAGITMGVIENSEGGVRTYTIEKNYHSTTGYSLSTTGGTPGGITNATFAKVGTSTTRIVYHVKKSTQPEVWVNPVSQPIEGTGQKIGAATQGNLTSIQKLDISFHNLVVNIDEFVVGDRYIDVCAFKGTVFVIR